jgi:hypothetical protein
LTAIRQRLAVKDNQFDLHAHLQRDFAYLDRYRLRTGHAARNRAVLWCIALNFLTILKHYFWPKMSIRWLRKMVARIPAQLEPIMAL